MAGKNICMVLSDKDFPPDIRVEKEARALAARGHVVTILCDRSGAAPLAESWEQCQIVRVRRHRGVLGKADTAASLITGYSGRWAGALARVVEERRIGVIHVHDLPMLGTALEVGRRKRVPVVADLHENYPALVALSNNRSETPWFRRALNSPARWHRRERRWLPLTARTIVVVEEARARLVAAGLPADHIDVVENVEDLGAFSRSGIDEELAAQYRGPFVVLYVGGLDGPHRGLASAIEAMAEVCRVIPTATLLLVGAGYLRPQLESLARGMPCASRISFAGWHPFSKIPTFISLAAVCLVPHLSNELTETTSPHKLGQYMLMGKPVVVSSCGPLKRVVQRAGSGVVYAAGDSRALAAAILSLRDERVREQYGRKGLDAAQRYLNWESASASLQRVYEAL
jgi:glycosyltransferase involved in cell wall biosynthesis